MDTPLCRISLADLSAARIRLQPSEAAAVALDVIQRAQHGHLPGIPLPNAIRLVSTGAIEIDGPVAAGHSIERAARLLDAMLPGFDAPPELRAPGALRIIIARAQRTLDLPPYRSLDEFAHAIARFAVTDHAAAVRALCATWASAMHDGVPIAGSEGPTISDIRRARRATGLSLRDIAERSRIPISLLRELEWGYFPNWPADQYGRTQLERYARAAGLDEDLVIAAVWPLVLEGAPVPPRLAVQSHVIEAEVMGLAAEGLVKREASAVPLARWRDEWKPRYVIAGGAIAALVTIGFIPAMWNAGDTAPAAVQSPSAPASNAREQTTSSEPSTRPAAAAKQQRSTQAAVRPAMLHDSVGFSPAFATTGSAMFYHSAAAGSSSIMRADTDTNGAVLRITRVVDDTAQNFHARPSPDGRMIAFDSDREGERAVYVADADGRGVRRVTGPGFAAVPSWSPDGGRLAFVRAEPDEPRVWNVWTVDLASGETTRLTSHRTGQPWGAAWFPDGERIAYSQEDRLIVRSVEGRSLRAYPSPKRGRLLRTPAVSPDGRYVMFQVQEDGGWLLDLSDGSMRRILADPTAEEFTWSPDGTRVAYHSRKSGTWSVWVMAPR